MIRKIPAWDSIRKIGQTRALRLTIFVPVIGYMILFNQQIVHVFELSKHLFANVSHIPLDDAIGTVSPETKTRLFYFYFGLTFLGLGSILYQLFCPRLIKEHASDREYVREEINLITETRAESLANYLQHNRSGMRSHAEYSQQRHYIKVNEKDPEERKRKLESETIDLMVDFWRVENRSSPLSRSLVLIFYVVGFVMLGIPSVQMFKKVVIAFIQ